MGKGFKRLLAPPDFTRKVDVPDQYVQDRLDTGFKLDDYPDSRDELARTIPDRHKGRGALVLGCGPSCGIVPLADVVAFVRKRNLVVVATNEVYKLFRGEPFPGADYVVVLDEPLWTGFRNRFGAYLMANPFCLPVLAFDPMEDVRYHRIGIDMGCEPGEAGTYRNGHYFYGRSSGIAAVQLALHAGCRDVYLLGHDLGSVDGRSHGWGPRRDEEVKGNYPQGRDMESGYRVLASHAQQVGAKVVNVSPCSLLDCFARGTIPPADKPDRKTR